MAERSSSVHKYFVVTAAGQAKNHYLRGVKKFNRVHLSVSNTLCYIITGPLTGTLPELISSRGASVFLQLRGI